MSKNLGSLVRDVIDGTSSFVTGEDLNGERYGPGILPDEKKWRSLQKTEDSEHGRWQFYHEHVYKIWVSYFIDDPWKN